MLRNRRTSPRRKSFLPLTAVIVLAGAIVAASTYADSLTFVRLAGSTGGGDVVDGSRTAARFGGPSGVAIDANGNLFVADTGSHTIRKSTPDGSTTTLAGKAGSPGTTDGAGGGARFNAPTDIVLDRAGNLFVADRDNHCIRKITPAGVVSTFAGASGVPGSADGLGGDARFRNPQGIAIDGAGNLIVADSGNHTIRRIDVSGAVSTLAGKAGFAAYFDGTGAGAAFNSPTGVAIDGAGNIFVADTLNYAVRAVTPAGAVTTIAGLHRGTTNGPGSAAAFYRPEGIAVDSSGTLFVADTQNHTIRKITADHTVSTFAGSARYYENVDGTGAGARFHAPAHLAIDGSGNLYAADRGNCSIRKITQAGAVTTVAGTGPESGSIDATGSAARFNFPGGIAIAADGNTFVADAMNHVIRKISPEGVVATFAGSAGQAGYVDGNAAAARFNGPQGIAVDAQGNVYVADSLNNKIRKITTAGVVSTIAGGYAFEWPTGIAIDRDGSLIVGDTDKALVERVTPDGTVTVLAGNPQSACESASAFCSPAGVAVDSAGNIYVADSWNHAIRRIAPNGEMRTFAGATYGAGFRDGIGEKAQFDLPYGVAVDAAGNIYVADSGNDAIRKITPDAVVTTIGASAGAWPGNVDGTDGDARFNFPQGITVDASGNLYVADTENQAIRRTVPAIADRAVVDSLPGKVGLTRSLGTTPTTATTWQWSLIRRPVASTAELSAISTANPSFTPDANDLFVFRLTASDGQGTRISTVSLMASIAGDANGDGKITVEDLFYLINALFSGGVAPANGDANGDGVVSAADVFYLMSYLFAGGSAPR